MNKIIIVILILIIIISLAIGSSNNSKIYEGITTLNDEYLNMIELPIDKYGTAYLEDGYYYVTDTGIKSKLMARIPTGYKMTPDKNGIYIDDPSKVYPIPCDKNGDCNVPSSYYKVGTTDTMAIIPYGFEEHQNNSGDVVSSGIKLKPKMNIINSPIAQNSPTSNLGDASYNSLIKYNSNNFNITYHDTIEPDKSLIDLGRGPIYYQSGAFKYGGGNYVPSYDDSVRLSKNNIKPSFTFIKPDICEKYKHFPQDIESACKKLGKSECKFANCCVLLGGDKCVAGNEEGPTFTSNYNDSLVKNRDHYYYNGKCYGNC